MQHLEHVFFEQAEFELIDIFLGLCCNFGYLQPEQEGASDVITLDSLESALTAFDTCGLLGFAEKLLNFPTDAA